MLIDYCTFRTYIRKLDLTLFKNVVLIITAIPESHEKPYVGLLRIVFTINDNYSLMIMISECMSCVFRLRDFSDNNVAPALWTARPVMGVDSKIDIEVAGNDNSSWARVITVDAKREILICEGIGSKQKKQANRRN
jgi:hypothetical protein